MRQLQEPFRRSDITSRNIAKTCAAVADEFKAKDITVLDVRRLCDFADYMVICTGDTRRQLRAIQRRMSDDLKPVIPGRPHVEGEEQSSWVLVDFYDVVVHLFDPEAREFYDLELLWGDAPRVAWKKKSTGR